MYIYACIFMQLVSTLYCTYVRTYTHNYNVMLRLKDPSQYVREHQGGSELHLKFLNAVYDPTINEITF